MTLCGCASKVTPAFVFPAPSTQIACIRSGNRAPLSKRVQVFVESLGTSTFTCNTDEFDNPYQDCINSMAVFCNATYIGSDLRRIQKCKSVVDSVALQLNSYWRDVRKFCGQWPWNGYTGSSSSPSCSIATSELQSKAYYKTAGGRVYVSADMTRSIRVGLWDNAHLSG